jgi:hypothetical protein
VDPLDEQLAFPGGPDRADHGADRALLGQEPAGPGGCGTREDVDVRVAGQDEDAGARAESEHAFGRLDPVAVRQVDVHQDHFRRLPTDAAQGLGDGGHRTHAGHVVLGVDRDPDGARERQVIVDDEYARPAVPGIRKRLGAGRRPVRRRVGADD